MENMSTYIQPLRRRGLPLPMIAIYLGVAVPLLALAIACGGGSSTPTTAPLDTPTPIPSGPGTITISSTAIKGHARRVLLVFAVQEGRPIGGRACIQIGSDSFIIPGVALTDVAVEGTPCGEQTPITIFPEGIYTVTAGVYAPPAQSPEKTSTQTVQVRGNVKVVLDGAALSK